MGDQMPREVEDADRVFGILFGTDDPEPGAETRLWTRIQRELGPQTRPWYARLGGLSRGTILGFPARRAALVGLTAAAMIAAVLVAPSLGGNSASAQILEAIDDLSAATTAALSDANLTEAELADLRDQAEGLLLRIQDNPSALTDLNLSDLTAAISSLQAVESLLVERQALASSVVTPVGQAAHQAERALQTRDPNSPLLAATTTKDTTIVEAAEGRRSFKAADAGTVVIDVRDGALVLVAARPATGWTAIPEVTAGREINVRFEQADGLEIEFEAELEGGWIETKIDVSEGGLTGGSGSSGSGSRNSGSGTATPGPTSTQGATSTPASTATSGATGTPEATSIPGTGGNSSGSVPASQGGPLQFDVGQGGSVTIDVSGGLSLVSATPSGGWAIVSEDVRADRIEIRFGQSTTQWRFDARLQDDGRIAWRVSQHLNEDPVGSSRDDR